MRGKIRSTSRCPSSSLWSAVIGSSGALVVTDTFTLSPAGWMARQKITVCHLTPAFGQILTDGRTALPDLRYAFFGGDVFYYLPLILICPAITMRLFAEERRSGTIETLLTTPVVYVYMDRLRRRRPDEALLSRHADVDLAAGA